MKKLLSNKFISLLIAGISILCVMFGAILTTPRNVMADSSTPDFATWEKRAVQVGDDLSGKYVALKVVEFGEGAYSQVSMTFEDNEVTFLYFVHNGSPDFFFDGNGLNMNTHKLTILNLDSAETDGFYIVKFDPQETTVELDNVPVGTIIDKFVVSSFDIHIDGSSANNSEDIIFVLEEPTIAEPGIDIEIDDSTLGDKINDGLNNVADWFNGVTGLAVSGSVVGVVAVGVVLYLVFGKRR